MKFEERSGGPTCPKGLTLTLLSDVSVAWVGWDLNDQPVPTPWKLLSGWI